MKLDDRTNPRTDERMNVLLVDDQPGKLLAYRAVLDELGENLISASSAREALDVLLRTDVALVLVDVCMPELDGFELAAMIREHPRFEKTAIMFVSGVQVGELDRLRGYAYGAVDYVPVPVVPEILRAKVRVFVDLHRKTRQLEALNRELEQRVADRVADLQASTERLRESEEGLRLALAGAGAAAWTWDGEGERPRWSPEVRTVLGLPADAPALALAEFAGLLHTADRDRTLAGFRDAFAKGAGFELEFRVVRPVDGETRWIRSTGRVEHDAARRPVVARGIHQDVTARKATDDVLRRQAALLDLASDAVFVWSEADGIRYWNAAAAEMYGFSAEEALGRAPQALLRTSLSCDLDQILGELASGASWQGEVRQTTRDGRALVVETRLRLVLEGEHRLVLETARDITERVRAEQAIRENERRLRIAIDAAGMGWWDYDVVADRLTSSQIASSLADLSVDLSGATSDRLLHRIHPDDRGRALEAVEAAWRERVSQACEVRVTQGDGSHRWVLVAGQLLADEHGRPARALGIALDISDRKAAEQALQDTDRRKDEFLAMLAHELRNPLAPILTSLHLLRTPGLPEARRLQAQQILDRQVEHLVRLVDDLLDVSRISRGVITLQSEQVDLVGVVSGVVDASRELLERHGHALVVDLPEDEVAIVGDPTRLAQVLGNVLNNAAKYTPDGGRIRLSLWVEGREAVVSVRDTGVGIPPRMLHEVFDLFTQVDRTTHRARGGLGIGLALVRRLVELHGGSAVALSDGPGTGTEIRLRLPLPAARSVELIVPTIEAVPVPPASAGLRVLVVDDNVDAAIAAATLLELAGHEVRVANDGIEALEVTGGFTPDVVLLDLGMPRLDGYETARRMRELPWGRSVTLVALTGWGQPQDRDKTTSAGFDAHLVKPVEGDDLLDLVARTRTVAAS